MKEFIKVYNQIINEQLDLKPEYIGLNIFNIMNEWVESPDLLEFPKELQIELCKHLRKNFDYLYIISYKQIISILQKYDYEYLDDVIDGMKKYDAINKGYLILINANIDISENFENNKTLNFIKQNYNDIYDNALDIFSKIYNNKFADGLTIFHRDEYDPENTYTCIYINRNSFNNKDTLEHELTHFIKRVAKYQNKFPKTYSGLSVDKLNSRSIKGIDYISNIFKNLQFSEQVIYSIKELILRTCTDIEEQPIIKSIINNFIRTYEQDNTKHLINHKYKTINQIENLLNGDELIKFRLNWITAFLEKVNNHQIFKDNKQVIEQYFNQRQSNKNYQIEFILKYIIYLVFKYVYPEYDIDNIIKYNFKIFKFRDI